MANLIETSKFEDDIYQLEKTDPVVAGKDGIANKQAQQLANRTLYLKNEQEKLKTATAAATTSIAGIVQLSSSTSGTSESKAATEKAVGDLNREKMNISGGTFTGNVYAKTPELTDNGTRLATTGYVQAKINALIGGAPTTLDTLKEIADALGDDANLRTTLLAEIAKKANASHTHTASNISDFNTAVTQLFTQSDNQQGWVKLPNGLIFQWGHSVQQSNTTQMYDITDRQASFPISFPKTCFSVFITAQQSQGAEEVENTFAVADHQLNLFRYRMYRVGGSNDPKDTVRINFFAIGM